MHKKDGRLRNLNSRKRLDFLRLSDNNMIVISLIISVAGLAALFVFSQNLAPNPATISEIQFLPEDDYVSFVGYVSKLTQGGQYQYVVVCDSWISSECVSVRVSGANVPLGLVEGDFVSVIGTVESGLGEKYVSVYGKEGIGLR